MPKEPACGTDRALIEVQDLHSLAAHLVDALEIIERLWEQAPNRAPIGFVTMTAKPLALRLVDGLEDLAEASK